MSSNDVTITKHGSSLRVQGLRVFELHPSEVAALRAHFAAERMPEDVADLLDVLADAIRSEAAIADRPGQMARLEAIADRLEAAYSQKAEAWDEGANAELARARSQGADDPGIPHPMNPYRKGAVDDPR